jgi:hypothetical protein
MTVKQFLKEVAPIEAGNLNYRKILEGIGAALSDEIKIFVPEDSIDWAPQFTEMQEWNENNYEFVIPKTGLAFVVESDQSESFYKEGVKRAEAILSYGGLEVQIY